MSRKDARGRMVQGESRKVGGSQMRWDLPLWFMARNWDSMLKPHGSTEYFQQRYGMISFVYILKMIAVAR